MKSIFVRSQLCLWVALFSILGMDRLSAQIFYVDYTQNPPSIIGHNFDGSYKNATPLLMNGDYRSIATDGTNLFVADFHYGVIGEYTTAGGVVNPSLISGLSDPLAMAVSGTNLYIGDGGASGGRIGKYSTSGAIINSNLITGTSGGFGIAIIGTNLYGVNGSSVGEFTTDGAVVNPCLISGLNTPGAMRTDGTNLFIVTVPPNSYSSSISEYSSSGANISPALISGTGYSLFLDVSGTNLFAYANNGIAQYTTSGTLINPSLIKLANYYTWGLVSVPIAPSALPPAVGITTYGSQPALLWPANGGNYTLQTTTNLTSGIWTTVSNAMPVTGAIVTNATSGTFRLQ